ncbi:MAG: hypothetical protein GHCLOJNM_02887 [bacterium]|nr:hypothetical protein [bacterium]
MVRWIGGGFLLACLVFGPPGAWGQGLSSAEVSALVGAAAKVFDLPFTVAVVSRDGTLLGVYSKTGAPSLSAANFGELEPSEDVAAALARTGAFFSNNQAPLSSRTIRFISGIHFPPGIANTPNAALYGIENTNRGCLLLPPAEFFPGKELPRSGRANGTFPGLGVLTGKAGIRDITQQYPIAVNGGGIPIYRGSTLVGGIGVAGLDSLGALSGRASEFAAIRGVIESGLPLGPVPSPLPRPGQVFVDGIRLPFVGSTLSERNRILRGKRIRGTPGPDLFPGPLPPGTWIVGPISSPRDQPPEGWLALPRDGVGPDFLTAAEVDRIIAACVNRANRTRAAIRLPPGRPSKMAIAVGDLAGRVIGLYRMPDSTVFSVDVAVTKARNAVYFSSPARAPGDLPGLPVGTAITARTLSFGSQPLYPPGINGSGPGPFFESLFVPDLLNPCTQGSQPPGGFLQSGIVFFPGSTPLYKNGVLVGGLGVSGDGVEQDDFVTAAGFEGFEPSANLRADHHFVDGVRLPYFKFPRNPTTGVYRDTSPPRVVAAAIIPGNTTVLVEVVAGSEIDQAQTLATLEVEVGNPLGPPPAGTVIDFAFTHVYRITFPAPLASGTPVRVRVEPQDVRGQSGGLQTLDLVAAKAHGGPDFTFDNRVDAADLLSLLSATIKREKVEDHDLTGDTRLDFSDQFEFSRHWHGEPDR